MKTRRLLLTILGFFLVSPLFGADPLSETEFTSSDAIRLLSAKGWSFSYAPAKPVRRLDVLIYEERTDEAGEKTTTVRHGCVLGMRPEERTFPIKMLLVGNQLYIMIDASKNSIEISGDFSKGAAYYHKTGDIGEGENGSKYLIEVGNKEAYKGQPPFKNKLKFKVYENLDQATLGHLLNGR